MKEEGMEDTSAMAVIEATGELVPVEPVRQIQRQDPYARAGTLNLNERQRELLARKFPDDAHDVLPTGEVYVSQVYYRRLLNEVFGPGGWAMVPRSARTLHGNTVCRDYALVVGGVFVAEAPGEADYQESNSRMSYASAGEACKSNALTRCCKDLGIAGECWEKRWAERWRAENCVEVWMGGGKKPQWRRKDAAPFYGETGIKEDRPQSSRPSQQAPPPAREPGEDDPDSPAPASQHQSAKPKSAGQIPEHSCGKVGVVSQYGGFYCRSCKKGYGKRDDRGDEPGAAEAAEAFK